MTLTNLSLLSFAVVALGCVSPTSLNLSASQGVTITDDHSDLDLKLDIPASGQRPRYTLTCRSWDFDGDVDYSGLQQCWLRDPRTTEAINLLSENQGSRGWDNRSRFLAHQLVGGCATDPDWGARRTYFAAGLKIQIGVDDVKLSGPDIARYRLTVRVDGAGDQVAKPLTPRPEWFDKGPCPN